MTPCYADDWLTIYEGDCRTVLATLPSGSVDCVVTSPPYWGLRDYGTDGQLGLERTPEEYVANMVAVFREVRRVLKPSGTCWLNLGSSYMSSGERTTGRNDAVRQGKQTGGGFEAGPRTRVGSRGSGPSRSHQPERAPAYDTDGEAWGHYTSTLKPKDMVPIPWLVAMALQADGWYLRSDIIWSKPNPMPESVTDRPTKSHEYLFLLTKAERYYFDADAVREADSGQDHNHRNVLDGQPSLEPSGGILGAHSGLRTVAGRNGSGRNIRSVWTIATRPYPGAHFAVFPPELPERCIKAGSPERGVCPECGAPWERVVARPEEPEGLRNRGNGAKLDYHTRQTGSGQKLQDWMTANPKQTTGWQPTCDCPMTNRGTQAAVILDPFAGSGTVGLVANSLSRRAILIDLNPEYLEQQMKRNAQTPLGLGVA